MNTLILPKILIGAALALGLIGAIAFGVSHFAGKAETKAETQSHVDQGQALAHAEAAKVSDGQVADLQTKLDATQTNLDRLTAERNALLKRLAVPKPSSTGPVALPSLPAIPSNAPDVRDEVIAKDAEVIAAQDVRIKGLESIQVQLVVSRDRWKSAYDAESRRAAGLEIALAAQKHVSASGKWLGRIEGFAVGVALGYAGGRIK